MIDFPTDDNSRSIEVESLLERIRDGLVAEEELLAIAVSPNSVKAWLQDNQSLGDDEFDALGDRYTLWLSETRERQERSQSVGSFWSWVRLEVLRGVDNQRKKDARSLDDKRKRDPQGPDARRNDKPDEERIIRKQTEDDSNQPKDSRAVLRSGLKDLEPLLDFEPEGGTYEDAFLLLRKTLFRIRLWRIRSHPNPRKNHFGDVWLARLVFGSNQDPDELTKNTRKINGWLKPYKAVFKRAIDRRMIQDSLKDDCEAEDQETGNDGRGENPSK
jgi:hypothetical protein